MLERTITPSAPPTQSSTCLQLPWQSAPSKFDQGVYNLITFGVIDNTYECFPLFAQNVDPPSGWMQLGQNQIKQGQSCFLPPTGISTKSQALLVFFFVYCNTFIICLTHFSTYKKQATPLNVLLEYTLIVHFTLYGHYEAILVLVDSLSLCQVISIQDLGHWKVINDKETRVKWSMCCVISLQYNVF